MQEEEEEFEINSQLLENIANKQRFAQHVEDDDEATIDEEEDLSDHELAERAPNRVTEQPNLQPKQPESIAVQHVTSQSTPQPIETDEFLQKKEYLIEIRKLRTRGSFFAKQFTFEDSIHEMKQALELARIEAIDQASQVRNKSGIKTARRVLLAGVSVLEFLHRKWNPMNLHLDGLGEYVMSNISDYDSVFSRLLEKYQGNGTMPPELELVVMLATSAVMFHISNMFVAKSMKAAEAEPQPRQYNSQASRQPDVETNTSDQERFE